MTRQSPQARAILFAPSESFPADAIPFDAVGAALGHQGAERRFDAIVRKYRLDEPALRALAEIVRGADTEARDLTPESGFEAIAEGFRLVCADDRELLRAELPVYDALYAACRARVGAKPVDR